MDATLEIEMPDGSRWRVPAANAMNWADVQALAVRVADPSAVDYQQRWVNGKKRVIREKTK